MPSAATASQFEAKDVLMFTTFEGMNTQSSRFDLAEKKAAWMENLQPIGPNNNLAVAAAKAALAALTGETVTKEYYFNFGQASDYIICFCASGSAYAVSNPGAAIVHFAPAATFTATPDCTQWGIERILIADAQAGYCSWDTHAFVQYGGVSPNIEITAGGGGYTSPTVAISGGSGSGATATVQQTGGVVTGITLTDPGTGYQAGDSLTLAISDGGPGTGATATGHIWPRIIPSPTTLAVFLGRVWLASTNILTWGGTGASYGGIAYDDFLTADASGSTTLNDPDLTHRITTLRSLNNYLFVIGDNSVKQIGNISVSGTVTNFTLTTLSSDQGTTFRDTVISYNRLVLFANQVGVYAVFGTSVEKISDDMDGIFRLIDFSQPLSAAVNDINNIHCFLLLARYRDPAVGTRSIILSFMNKKWFVISQGDELRFITTGIVDGTTQTFSTSGSDITQILSDPDREVDVLLKTSLTSHGAPYVSKKIIRWATAQQGATPDQVSFTLESERSSDIAAYIINGAQLTFIGAGNIPITFIGAGSQPLSFFSALTFQYQPGNSRGVSGIYLGGTIRGAVKNYSLNAIMLEYAETAAFANTLVAAGAQ